MSGHSKWATTKHRKAAQDSKRSALFSKLSRNITVAAKEGGDPNPDNNASLAAAIEKAPVSKPVCPVYQNVDALPHTDPVEIKDNLLKQLTAPVRWTQSVINMIGDGMTEFVECGPGQVLTGLIGRIQKSLE